MLYFLAEQRLSWLSPLSVSNWWLLVAACVLFWLVLQVGWGRPVVRRRFGLVAIRAACIGLALLILLGPTVVNETPGATSRPTMFYLFDGSQSMNLGRETTRWQDSLDFVSGAEMSVGEEASSHTKSFRFGHRLMPLSSESHAPDVEDSSAALPDTKSLNLISSKNLHQQVAPPAPPDASDSRLADALRQLSPQMDPDNSAGVVLLSDGRVRATESVERLAEHFGKHGTPIHVVPVGELEGTGDVAIVSLVVEPRVRKFTENQLTLFIRSFGFNGQPTTIRVLGRSRIAEVNDVVLAELPIILNGGAQSASLTFRVEDRPEDLTVVVEPIRGELTDRNNSIQTRVDIDRTKLRVLYVEGDVNNQQLLLRSLLTFGESSLGPTSVTQAMNVRQALQADEDIECTVLIRRGSQSLMRISDGVNETNNGFPKTRAELFAYDCVVLSNLGPDVLDEEQAEQLALWIEGRGGGLIVTGSQALDATFWEDHPVAPYLPIVTEQLKLGIVQPTSVQVTQAKHPIWRLRLEQTPNEQLLAALPPLSLGVRGVIAKPTAEVLATTRDSQPAPVMIAHRAGRGRVIVSTADLGGTALVGLAETWGPQPERVASKLWRNMVYWATEGSSIGRRRLMADSDKRFYRPGEKMVIDAVAYDEAARKSDKYRIWAMFEPMSLDDVSIYSPVLWPENVVRESGEVGPRIAWGEELPLSLDALGDRYQLELTLSEASGSGDSGMRIEMTAYEGSTESGFDHGTQVDSTSLAVHVLNDPFEQQNPLPNREFLIRIANLSGGQVLEKPEQLAHLLEKRHASTAAPTQDLTPAWSRWWIWLAMLAMLTTEWIWRRNTGLA